MSLSAIRSTLFKSIRSPHAVSLWRGALDDPELESFATFEHALDELGCSAPERYPMRERLARFLIAQAQGSKDPVWTAVLIVAFVPMLNRLRGGLRGRLFEREELDQIVVAAFVEVVASFPLEARGDRTAMYLRQDTRRAVLRVLTDEQRARAEQCALRDRAKVDREVNPPREFNPFTESASGNEPNEEERWDLERLVRALLEKTRDARHADLICRTTVGGQSVASYVDELHPGTSGAERDRLYELFYRRRRRALERLRATIGDPRLAEAA